MPEEFGFSNAADMHKYWMGAIENDEDKKSKTSTNPKKINVHKKTGDKQTNITMFICFLLLSFVGSITMCVSWLYIHVGIHLPSSNDSLMDILCWFERICAYYTGGISWLAIPITILFALPFDRLTKRWWKDFVSYTIVLFIIFIIVFFEVCRSSLFDPWEEDGKFNHNAGFDMFNEYVLKPLNKPPDEMFEALKNAKYFLLCWPSTKNDTYSEYYIFGRNILKCFNVNIPAMNYETSESDINDKLCHSINDISLRIKVEDLLLIPVKSDEKKQTDVIPSTFAEKEPQLDEKEPQPDEYEILKQSIHKLFEENLGFQTLSIQVNLPYEIILSQIRNNEYVWLYAICQPSELKLLYKGPSAFNNLRNPLVINLGNPIDMDKCPTLFNFTFDKQIDDFSGISLADLKQTFYSKTNVPISWGLYDSNENSTQERN